MTGARAVRVVAVVVIVAAVVVGLRVLPTGEVAAALGGWIDGLGPAGPVVFGLFYVAATVLLLPGAALGLAAGAAFGVAVGTVTVSLASTTGAALAFLIARFLARRRVERMMSSDPRLEALDAAVAEGGWRIVALLRLSPAVPFNVQNYAYGVTPIGFRTCVLTSWIAMLPGTVLYVFLGHVGAAAAGPRRRTAPEWTALGIGLLATVAVTWYVTALARRKLADVRAERGCDAGAAPVVPARRRTTVLLTAAAMVAVAGAFALHANADAVRSAITRGFGPPAVLLRETVPPGPGTATFDHAAFDRLLRAHVDAEGRVDYAALAREPAGLDAVIAALATAPLDAFGRDERLAFLINAYNACTLRLILDHWPLASIRSIPAAERWDAVRWRIGGHTWSLNQIEHEQIRPKFREPRIHFALVCAAVGCPPLRNEAYTAARLEPQLEAQAVFVHGHERWVRFDAERGVLALTTLYDWYGGDFRQVAASGTTLGYVARYVPALRAGLDAGRTPKIRWLAYDWTLNGPTTRPAADRNGG